MILKPFMLRRIKRDVENELSEKVSVVYWERTGYYNDNISKTYLLLITLPLGTTFCYIKDKLDSNSIHPWQQQWMSVGSI